MYFNDESFKKLTLLKMWMLHLFSVNINHDKEEKIFYKKSLIFLVCIFKSIKSCWNLRFLMLLFKHFKFHNFCFQMSQTIYFTFIIIIIKVITISKSRTFENHNKNLKFLLSFWLWFRVSSNNTVEKSAKKFLALTFRKFFRK